MPVGIRISPAGVDAEKATIKDLVYTSETDAFKIHKMGITANPAKSTAFFIDHDLRYRPFFWIFEEAADGQARKMNYFADVASTDSEEIRTISPNSTPTIVDLYYYIFINIIL